MRQTVVIGAGPAGSAAAIAALREGASVRLFEKSHARRHKVCGEFISPDALEILAGLGMETDFQLARPARIQRCILRFGRREKQWTLPEPAYGLSRYQLDSVLLRRAVALGAQVIHETAPAGTPAILAAGRQASAPRGDRLFGFKAHFEGPQNDAVELFFFRGGYAGVSSVENGTTNVCGMAHESALRRYGFRLDEFVMGREWLAERLRPLTRKFEWLTTGPLIFSPGVRMPAEPGIYPAGDALGFIDPFTGSGILNALLTGSLAGRMAARGAPVEQYISQCRRRLGSPLHASAFLRRMLEFDCVGYLASLVPGRLLFRLTRAAV